ncbi:MAG: NADH-quinone oxidoreductase subunit N [Anaerolineales bacterium]
MNALQPYLAILPEISLIVVALLALLFDALWDEAHRRNLGWLTFGGVVFTLALMVFAGRPGSTPSVAWGGMVRHDWLGFTFGVIFLFGAGITTLLGMDVDDLGRRGEFYVLLLVSTLGMMFMAAAADVIMLFLAIETTSIPLYVLAGFFRRDTKSTEAGFKYLLFGAMASAVMLYGFSLVYGFTGTTSLIQAAQGMAAQPLALSLGVLVLLLVGFGFKISVAPLHFWAPDVYEGAPTPVAGFLSTASKAAGFAVLMRVLLTVFPTVQGYWPQLIAVVSAVTMTLGNLLAINQKNIKRLLAYSSIAHAGYALVGFVAVSELGVNSVVFYMGAYLLTNLAAFGVAGIFWQAAGTDEIAAYAGMSRRKPWLALAMLAAFLSLSGMPPFAGFVAKVVVFAAAMQAGWTWLVVVGVLNSIVGLYYYLKVLNEVYHHRNEETESLPLPISAPQGIALVVLAIGILVVGFLFGPFFNLTSIAATALF